MNTKLTVSILNYEKWREMIFSLYDSSTNLYRNECLPNCLMESAKTLSCSLLRSNFTRSINQRSVRETVLNTLGPTGKSSIDACCHELLRYKEIMEIGPSTWQMQMVIVLRSIEVVGLWHLRQKSSYLPGTWTCFSVELTNSQIHASSANQQNQGHTNISRKTYTYNYLTVFPTKPRNVALN